MEACADSLPHLLLGRAIYGCGIGNEGVGVLALFPRVRNQPSLAVPPTGLAMHAAPAYIAETSPPSVRGLLLSCKEVAIVGGMLAG